jgi:MYXO-CTERM domain-containing protein
LRLALAVLLCSAAAQAQTGEAGASAGAAQPDDPRAAPAPGADAPSSDPAGSNPAGSDPSTSDPPSSEPPADPSVEPAPPAANEPGVAPGGFPKTLTPEQASPDNLQGWLRERNRRRPALVARPPLPPAPSLRAVAEPAPAQESALEGYRRRLRSFDEHGVTVLSNRHAEPALARVSAAAALAVPAPVSAAVEPEPDRQSVTETRSLRANQPRPRRVVSEPGLDWPVFAVPVAAIGLALIWLRRRRAAD